MNNIYNYNLGNCGMSLQGAINRGYLKLLKAAIKKHSAFPDSQSLLPYRITWECKSEKDAVEHGYHKEYWGRLKTLGATLIKIEESGWGIHAVTRKFVTGGK